MRKYLFEKARYLLKQIKILSETPYSISFLVGEYHVTLKYQNHKLIALCECKAGSLNHPCSHILACITYIVNGKNLFLLGKIIFLSPQLIHFKLKERLHQEENLVTSHIISFLLKN